MAKQAIQPDIRVEFDPIARLALEKSIRDVEVKTHVSTRDEIRDFRRKRREQLIDDVAALVARKPD